MVGTKICLDSGVVFDFLTGEENAKQKIKLYSKEDLCITSITLFEIKSVVEKQEIISELMSFMTVLNFDENAAEIAAHILREDLHYGTTRGTKNIMNAAICIANDTLLFTKERKEFEGIKKLKLV